MKNLLEVLQMKEEEILRLRKEIEALKITARQELPMRVFKFSVTYLMWLFAALLLDHYLPTTQSMTF